MEFLEPVRPEVGNSVHHLVRTKGMEAMVHFPLWCPAAVSLDQTHLEASLQGALGLQSPGASVPGHGARQRERMDRERSEAWVE